MTRRCPDCKNTLRHCKCEPWWKAVQQETYKTFDAIREGRDLKPLAMSSFIVTTDSTNGWGQGPGRSVGTITPNVPKGCAHTGQPLKVLTDTMAACWDCGQQFEVKPLI